MVKIKCNYMGFCSEVTSSKTELILGRKTPNSKPHVPLNIDSNVEPIHAKIWKKDDRWWVEDLSTNKGTFLNGHALEAPQILQAGDVIKVGSTELTVEEVTEQVDPASNATSAPLPEHAPPTAGAEDARVPRQDLLHASADESNLMVSSSVNALKRAPLEIDALAANLRSKISSLLEIPLELAAASGIENLCLRTIESIFKIIPNARRGIFFVVEKETGKLVIQACLPEDPPVSATLVKRTISEGRAFLWRCTNEMEITDSMQRHSMASGMYCPLFWQNDLQGVLCVDSANEVDAFSEDDLKMLVAISQYAAAAIANYSLQENLRQYASVMERLQTNFSPKLKQRLADLDRRGKLSPGGQNSEITLLICGLRGFKMAQAGLNPDEALDMLHEYSREMVRIIFENEGTVYKFVGDTILAVFGSPDSDSQQNTRAAHAALSMQRAIHQINSGRKWRKAPTCELGVGIHCGDALHGFIGVIDRLEFAIIGDVIKQTMRYGYTAPAGDIIASPELGEKIRGDFELVPVAVVSKNNQELPAFRVVKSLH